MILTISGLPGSGKSTIADMLAKTIGLRKYDIGVIRRNIALRRHMTLEEYNTYGETHTETDTDVDDYQRELGTTEDDFIMVGRLSYHFIPHSIKIFMTVDPKVGAQRIFNDLNDEVKRKARNETSQQELSRDDVQVLIDKRQTSDFQRYQTIYNIDPLDRSQYDLVIDTTNKTPEQVLYAILQYLFEQDYISISPSDILRKAETINICRSCK